jgi:hypothetical protein
MLYPGGLTAQQRHPPEARPRIDRNSGSRAVQFETTKQQVSALVGRGLQHTNRYATTLTCGFSLPLARGRLTPTRFEPASRR